MVIKNEEDIKEMKIDKDLFELVQLDDTLHDEKFQGEPIGFFKDAWIRFKDSRAAVISGLIILVIIIMSLVGPSFNQYTYRQQHVEWSLMPPRIPGLEKLGIADGTKILRVREENLESKYGDFLVKVEGEEIITHKGKDIKMIRARIDMYKMKDAKDKYFWFENFKKRLEKKLKMLLMKLNLKKKS